MGDQIFSDAWLKQDAHVKRRVLRQARNEIGTPGRVLREAYYEGYVDGDIAAAADAGTPETGYVIVWAEDDAGTWAKRLWPDGTDMRIEIRHRFDFALDDNTYVHIRRVGRYWQMVAGSCAAEA